MVMNQEKMDLLKKLPLNAILMTLPKSLPAN